MSLTVIEVKNAKPGARHYKLADSNGLHLFVAITGRKVWRWKYRSGVKEKLLTLGRFPDLGLAEARKAAEDARRLLLAGKDPGLEAQRHKQAEVDAAEATFAKAAQEWFEDQLPLWSKANATGTASSRARLLSGFRFHADRKHRKPGDPQDSAQYRGSRIDRDGQEGARLHQGDFQTRKGRAACPSGHDHRNRRYS